MTGQGHKVTGAPSEVMAHASAGLWPSGSLSTTLNQHSKKSAFPGEGDRQRLDKNTCQCLV